MRLGRGAPPLGPQGPTPSNSVASWEDWWPEKPMAWAVGFAVFYFLAYWLTDFITELSEVIPDRVSLIYIPAFVRVVSVLVAGLAGLLGIFIGTLGVSILYVGDPAHLALANATASTAGIGLSYWLMLKAMGRSSLPLNLPVLVLLTVLYSTFNAMTHGLVWDLIGMGDGLSTTELALMMIGDLTGVVLMYFILRLGIRYVRRARRSEEQA